jgi:hypothetical protein
MEVHSRNKVDAMHKNNYQGQLLQKKKAGRFPHGVINELTEQFPIPGPVVPLCIRTFQPN